MPLKRKTRYKTVQHHVLYNYDGISHKQVEITVPIYYTEHYICKLLQTRGSKISKGFIKVLEYFIWLNRERAVDLSLSQVNTIKETLMSNPTPNLEGHNK